MNKGFKMKTKKLKVEKDPEAPKRPSSSFLLFAKEERGKIFKDMSPISVGEAGRELGRRWSGLEDSVKERFMQMAQVDRLRYKKEMETYKPSELFLHKTVSQLKKNEDHGSQEDYFKFLSSQWRIVASAHPGISAVHIQDLVWQKWITGKLGMTEDNGSNMRKEKKVTKMAMGSPMCMKQFYGGLKENRGEIFIQCTSRDTFLTMVEFYNGKEVDWAQKTIEELFEIANVAEKYQVDALKEEIEEAARKFPLSKETVVAVASISENFRQFETLSNTILKKCR